MSSGSKRERPEASAGKPALDDSANWLVTFSDLVMQLFAFVVVAAVLSRSGSEGTPSPREILREAADSLVGIAAPIPGVPVAHASHLRARAAARITRTTTTGTAGVARPHGFALAKAPLHRSDDGPAVGTGAANGRATGVAPNAARDAFPDALAPVHADTRASTLLAATGQEREKLAPDAQSNEANPPLPGTEPHESEFPTEPRAEPPPRAPSADPGWRSISRYLEALLGAGQDRGIVAVDASSSGVLLRVGEAAGFDIGEAELNGEHHDFIAAVAALAGDLPELVIEIAGHTDDRPLHGGRFDSNLDLSFARARHVADRLLRAEPALAGRILVAGWGADRPLVPNDSAATRALNRRVEIRLRAAA